MNEGREISFSATDPLKRKVIAYKQTMDWHRIKHREPFSDDDVIDCIEKPHLIGHTGHDTLSHKDRFVYYKRKGWGDDGPDMMKLVVEHGEEPGVLTSAFRTDRFTKDGVIEYYDKAYYKGGLK